MVLSRVGGGESRSHKDRGARSYWNVMDELGSVSSWVVRFGLMSQKRYDDKSCRW